MKAKIVLNSDDPASDIKAVANSRYMRRAGNKLVMFMVVALIIGFGGAYLSPNPMLKLLLCVIVVGCAIFLAFMMDKGQKRERDKLMKEVKEARVGG